MNLANKEVENKVKFFDTFEMETDAIAALSLSYHPDEDMLFSDSTDVYGETMAVRLKFKGNEILELEATDENALADEFAEIFAELNFEVKAFIETIQEKYKDENRI
ncbi:hypothetical protein [Rossellomorea marisflavi]|uniref:hypothetical protein n=1 Tax=Rossellomorea marisflavi TaxID=189381 RepID=UPI003FA00914